MWYHSTDQTPMARGRTMSALADYIRLKLNEKNWLPAELARRAKISRGGLSHILNKDGNIPKPGTLEKIAGALGVEPVELTSKVGYTVDRVNDPGSRDVRLARAIVDRPWMAARQELLLSLSQDEFDELMDEVEFRRKRRKNRRDQG